MTSTARIVREPDGWYVTVQWGSLVEVDGPYRWRWVARFLAWLDDGVH